MFRCVPSKRCNSNSSDPQEGELNVDLREDYQEFQSCDIDSNDDNIFVDITQRQAKQYEPNDEFVCCKIDEVLAFTECPLSTDM